MGVQTYRELLAWQRAMELVTMVYEISQTFPREECFGLVAQIRRCAVSIPSNIAEGQGRGVGNEFCHHLRIAQGSLQELETQLYIGRNLGYVNELDPVLQLAGETGRLIRGLHASVGRQKITSN
jgi:four helix bundle protein